MPGTPTIDHFAWMVGPDTGLSSIVIWKHMTGYQGPLRTTIFGTECPFDADDFGRCYRLLRRFPEWRARLHELAALSPEWATLVEHWDALERLFHADNTRAASALIQGLLQVIYDSQLAEARLREASAGSPGGRER